MTHETRKHYLSRWEDDCRGNCRDDRISCYSFFSFLSITPFQYIRLSWKYGFNIISLKIALNWILSTLSSKTSPLVTWKFSSGYFAILSLSFLLSPVHCSPVPQPPCLSLFLFPQLLFIFLLSLSFSLFSLPPFSASFSALFHWNFQWFIMKYRLAVFFIYFIIE